MWYVVVIAGYTLFVLLLFVFCLLFVLFIITRPLECVVVYVGFCYCYLAKIFVIFGIFTPKLVLKLCFFWGFVGMMLFVACCAIAPLRHWGFCYVCCLVLCSLVFVVFVYDVVFVVVSLLDIRLTYYLLRYFIFSVLFDDKRAQFHFY